MYVIAEILALGRTTYARYKKNSPLRNTQKGLAMCRTINVDVLQPISERTSVPFASPPYAGDAANGSELRSLQIESTFERVYTGKGLRCQIVLVISQDRAKSRKLSLQDATLFVAMRCFLSPQSLSVRNQPIHSAHAGTRLEWRTSSKRVKTMPRLFSIFSLLSILYLVGGCQNSEPSPPPPTALVSFTPTTIAVQMPTTSVATPTIRLLPFPSKTPRPRRLRPTPTAAPPPRFGTPFPTDLVFSFPPVAELSNRIAYQHAGLWIANPDGTDRHNVFSGEGRLGQIGRVRWSNDGTHLAFFAGPGVVVTDLRQGRSRVIYHTAPRDEFQQHRLDHRSPGVAWEPNNKAVAFVEDDRIYVAWLERNEITRIVEGANYSPDYQIAVEDRLEWTRDGNWILYRHWGGTTGVTGLAVVSPTDPTRRQVVIPDVIGFALSPNGQFIAFTVKEGELQIAETSCFSEAEGTCVRESRTIKIPQILPYGVLHWDSSNSKVLAGHTLVDLATETGRVLNLETNLYVVGSNPISPAGDEVLVSSIFDGGMTDSKLLIFDLETEQTRPFIEFDYFSKSRVAVWSPLSQPQEPRKPGYKLYKNTEGNYQISYPATWSEDQVYNHELDDDLVVMSPDTNNTRGFGFRDGEIQFSVGHIKKESRDSERFFTRFEQDLKNAIGTTGTNKVNGIRTKTGNIKIAGNPAVTFSYQENWEGEVYGLFHYIKANDTIYSINFLTANKKTMDEYQAEITNILDSFQ